MVSIGSEPSDVFRLAARQPSVEIRPSFASPDEVAEFERYRATLDRPPDNLKLVYLIKIDGETR
jgi:hypothetical protein